MTKAAILNEYKVSRFIVQVPLGDPSSPRGQLVYSTRSQRSFILSDPSDEALSSIALHSTKLRKELVASKILVPAVEDEVQTILEENRQYVLNSDTLYHVIQPSAFCQMSCGYCGQVHSKKSIALDTKRKIVNIVDRQLSNNQQYKKLSISWFGAEPLAASSDILSTSRDLISTARAHQCTYSAKIVTNGVALSFSLAKKLRREALVDFAEVTIDGMKASHDAARPMRNGRSSFDRIIGNIFEIANSDIDLKIRVRCNVSSSNTESILDLVEHLNEIDLLKKITIYVAPLHAWGNDADKQGLDYKSFADFELQFFELVARHLHLEQPKLIPDRKFNTCLNTKPNSYVFDALGNVHDCTEVAYVPNEPPSQHSLANLEFGDAEVRSFKEYHAGAANGRYPCHSCRVLPLCGGSCPKLWTEGHIPCPSLKHNIAERLLMTFAN